VYCFSRCLSAILLPVHAPQDSREPPFFCFVVTDSSAVCRALRHGLPLVCTYGILLLNVIFKYFLSSLPSVRLHTLSSRSSRFLDPSVILVRAMRELRPSLYYLITGFHFIGVTFPFPSSTRTATGFLLPGLRLMLGAPRLRLTTDTCSHFAHQSLCPLMGGAEESCKDSIYYAFTTFVYYRTHVCFCLAQ
jgi:hypothetical protein